LLDVERVSARALAQFVRLGRERRIGEQGRYQLGRLVGGERSERDRRRVPLTAPPAGTLVEESLSRGTDEQQRDLRGPVGDVLDEVEQRRIRPVQVFHGNNQRRALGHSFEERAPSRKRL